MTGFAIANCQLPNEVSTATAAIGNRVSEIGSMNYE